MMNDKCVDFNQSKQMRIPYLSLQKVTAQHQDEIESAVKQVIESGWYLQGEATRRFENDYARFIGTQCCVGCGNGLDALTLIFRAYKELGKLRDGDEVIVPANTYIASILSITENGLKPVLVEPRIDTLELDDSQLETHLSDRTRAVLLVHLYGRCAMTQQVADFCHRRHLLLIEDNAQAHGCMYGGRRTALLGMLLLIASILARILEPWATQGLLPQTMLLWLISAVLWAITVLRASMSSSIKAATAAWMRYRQLCSP